MPGALTAAGLGIALILAGLGFGTPSLLVPGVGLFGLGRRLLRLGRARGTAAASCAVPGPRGSSRASRSELKIRAARRAPADRRRRAHRPRAAQSRSRLGPRWSGSVDPTVRIRGRGRRRLEPARLEIRDPLGLRVAHGAQRGPRAICSCCRGSSRCWSAARAPAAFARAPSPGSRRGPRAASSTPGRSSSRSTGCAPTARAPRPRGSTGPRSPARAS